ncbi:MAG: hypothetical protein F2804_05315, partial [Actinobacteria bacterium]|nr:hypothetical protein [Actinomycetota bacterium]
MRNSRRLLVATILGFALSLTSINAAVSGIRPDLTQSTQGLSIIENVNFKRSVPNIITLPKDLATQGKYFCVGIDDPKCVAATQFELQSHLPPCDQVILTNCVSSVYAVDA